MGDTWTMKMQTSALSQLKIRVELKPVRWTSSPSVPEFVNGLEVRRTLILSCDKALVTDSILFGQERSACQNRKS